MSVCGVRSKQKCGKIPTKIVIRRLPPNFTGEILKEQVAPLAQHDYFYFVKSDHPGNPNTFSRAYVNFIRHQDALRFKEIYDMYVFLGAKGMEYPAVVEYALFQRIPKQRLFEKRDVKCGTIFYNECYREFLNDLKNPGRVDSSKPVYNLHLNRRDNQQSDDVTPLLKYVIARKLERFRNRKCEYSKSLKCFENAVVFVNSSIKKDGNRKPYMRRHLQF